MTPEGQECADGFKPDLSHAAVFRPAPIEIAPGASLPRFGGSGALVVHATALSLVEWI
jgi:hypothetical protein